ncbi:MAG: DUF3750 domain-containing protein [Gammaproteobacteria bacterium]|nr:DUF3750 domain-containing protein [Gammaproteobacteria bacterium]
MKWIKHLFIGLAFYLSGPLLVAALGGIDFGGNWQTASRDSTGMAPAPEQEPRAVVQIYAGRAFGWRGVFGVHTWIATKERGANHYITHQVLGWRARYGAAAVVQQRDLPDRRWYGAEPELLLDLRGQEAARAIPRIYAAVANYPHAYEYTVWPGPNSNTFTAHIARQIPELKLDLPPTAIGKDYLAEGALMALSPSGTGGQISLAGVAGILVGWEEGIEFNLLGLSMGLDPLDLAIKLPGIGRLSAF